uniref:MORN repeat-containing protein n=1 Tax=Bigelowiella natans TaxID=227086 RepID=A0A7S2KM06_BIGNA|mmetsp:Transcript_667/g.995  ORF Transcript_667/g.995 Transcript_667/m.995 type:complete len:381 (+) Transcript_667:40-1182(+)
MPKKEEETVEEATPTEQTGSSYFFFETNAWYNGEWRRTNGKDIKKHGKGTLRTTSGLVYDGEWKNDLKDGQGTLKLPSGDTYEGAFVGGKFEGKGTCKWNTGARYEGEWKAGRMHGVGEFIDTDGNRFQGQFRGNKFLNQTGFFISAKDDEVGPFKPEDYIPKNIGTCIEKVQNFWFRNPEDHPNIEKLYRGENLEEKLIKQAKGLFGESVQLLDEVWKICEGVEGLDGALAFIIISGPLYKIITGGKTAEAKEHLSLIEEAVKKLVPKAEELSGFKALYLFAAMASTEDKEISASGTAGIDKLISAEEEAPLLKEIAAKLKGETSDKIDLIAKFSRDPRLNKIMGRESTEEEKEWLKANGFSENNEGLENQQKGVEENL